MAAIPVPPDPHGVADITAWLKNELYPWVVAVTEQANKLTAHEISESAFIEEGGPQINPATIVARMRQDHKAFRESEPE